MSEEDIGSFSSSQDFDKGMLSSPYAPYQPVRDPQMNNISSVEIENAKLIERAEMQLRGYMFDHGSKKWEKKRQAYMTEEGINDMVNFMITHLDKNTIMSHLQVELVDNVAKAIRHDLVDIIRFKHKEYEIDKAKRTLILDIIFNPILFAIKRAEGGDEKRYRTQTLSVGQHIVERPEKRFFGLFSRG